MRSLAVSATLFLTVAAVVATVSGLDYGNDVFGIDAERDTFIKNGKPYRYMAGDIHYSRIHPALWADRLQRVRHLGLNAIQVYVPWNFHEDVPGEIDFTSVERDLDRFLTLAKEYELDVLLRIGPYICAEWENGGLPWWLLRTPDIGLRRSDPRFLKSVSAFFNVLLLIVKKHIYVGKNSGPIILIQIENEYGSLGVCDRSYMTWLRDQVLAGLENAPVTLYTTDGPSKQNLKCGTVDGVYPTVDFGPGNATNPFNVQREFIKGGPFVNSEYYVTWFTHWGDKDLPYADTEGVLTTIDEMWRLNASFTIYMIHGGTNFGFWAGSHKNAPLITSYDYVAPISEGGDITATYLALHKWIGGLSGWPQPPLVVPQNFSSVTVQDVPAMGFDFSAIIPMLLPAAHKCLATNKPATFEEFQDPYTFVWYTTSVASGVKHQLDSPNVNNIGYVYLNDDFVGIVSSLCDYKDHPEWCRKSITLPAHGQPTDANRTLAILVENTGRINYETVHDLKGLGSVTLDGKDLTHWYQCGIDFELLSNKKIKEIRKKIQLRRVSDTYGPSFYVAQLETDNELDWNKLNLYFDTRPFVKGFTVVNGFNIGRFWSPLGPQQTLYTPGLLIQPGDVNFITVIELVGGDGYCNRVLARKSDDDYRNAKPTYRKTNRWPRNSDQKMPKIGFVDHPIYSSDSSPVTEC